MVTAAEGKRRRKNTPSSIDRLDPEIRALIGQLRVDRGWTIDEIRARLIEMGQQDVPSRSALGRHVRSLAEVSADLRESQVYAEALAREAGSKGGGQLLDMNAQLLGANMFKLMLAGREGEGVQLSSKEAKEFSEALRNLALTRKTELDVIEKAEKRAADKATKAAAESVTRAARSKGLSKDMVDAMRHAVLGNIFGQAIAGWLFADLVTGIFHWWEDRVGREDMPIIGKWLIGPNRLHHTEPLAFLDGNVCDRSLAVFVTAAIVALAWLAITGPSVFWASACLGGAMSNEVHAWAHVRRPGSLVALLQEIGLFQSPRHHAGHHRAPSDTRYCVLTDWLNPVLDRVRLWSRLEGLLRVSA